MNTASLKTSDEVIDALGGTARVAELTHRLPQSVSNWRKAGRLPSDTFLIISGALKSKGMAAPPSLWGIVEPERRSA